MAEASAKQRRKRVLSGMRPTGMLHLGHYFLLRKWAQMQDECDCHFFVADYHALTTASDRSLEIQDHTTDMLVCWLAAGIDPRRSVLFLQSQLHEHAELHLLLSMVTPLPWLERVPHFKDMAAKLKPEEINYGFLGYPVLQAADIIIHDADLVPVGDDQEAHVELAAKVARSFNSQFGKDGQWKERCEKLIASLSDPQRFIKLCRDATQDGSEQARSEAEDIVWQACLGREETQRLLGWIDGTGRQILRPPRPMKGTVSRLPGLDGGTKMSKSEKNDIEMLEDKASHAKKVKEMPTDPARVRRTDPGDPEKCPVWSYHKIFSSAQECEHVQDGCKSAQIGCIECKGMLTDNIEKVIAPLREKAKPWLEDKSAVLKMLQEGNEKARESARIVMGEVRASVGLPITK